MSEYKDSIATIEGTVDFDLVNYLTKMFLQYRTIWGERPRAWLLNIDDAMKMLAYFYSMQRNEKKSSDWLEHMEFEGIPIHLKEFGMPEFQLSGDVAKRLLWNNKNLKALGKPLPAPPISKKEGKE